MHKALSSQKGSNFANSGYILAVLCRCGLTADVALSWLVPSPEFRTRPSLCPYSRPSPSGNPIQIPETIS